MKKKILCILIILSLAASILPGCDETETVVYKSESLPEPIIQNKNSINIIVDPRVELLSIVQYLSNYRKAEDYLDYLITSFDFDYTEAIIEHFDEFRDHDVVKYIDKLATEGFTFDAPPALMLHMNNDFKPREDAPISDYLLTRAAGQSNIDKLFSLLEDFSVESGFNDFFNNNKEYYSVIIDNTMLLINDEKNIVTDLENYYGTSKASYNVILTSLYGPVGYGPETETEEGDHIYSIIGTQGTQFKNGNKVPSFGTKSGFEYLQNHEFSHSFINPITDESRDLVNSYDHLFLPIEEQMSAMAYNTWENCLNEHIIRALTSRFAYLTDEDEGLHLLKEEKEKGFIYVEELFHKLEIYENNRDTYSTIEDFYPELLSALN